MASISIEQPQLSSPAHEWAASTADALANASPSERGTAHEATPGLAADQATSSASTPHRDLPGAFPQEPRDAVDHLANAAPTQDFDVTKHLETVKQYIPASDDVQRAVGSIGETARNYLPERMVNTLGLPVDTTDTAAVDSKLRPSPSVEQSSSSVDNASTTAVAPSTRSGSFQTNLSGGNEDFRTQVSNYGDGSAVAGIATFIDLSPSESNVSNGLVPEDENSVLKTPQLLPLPESHTDLRSSPLSSAEVSPAAHMLPTPPLSQTTSSSSANDFPLPSSRSNVQSDAPTPPAKDTRQEEEIRDAATPGPREGFDQPGLNTSPAQPHVSAGTGVSVIGGTASAESPHASKISTASNTSLQDGDVDDKSGGESDGERTGEGKKGSRTRRIVEKVKGKLHRGH